MSDDTIAVDSSTEYTIDIADVDLSTFTTGVSSSNMYSTTPAYGNITISNGTGAIGNSGQFLYSTGGTTGPLWTHNTTGAGLHVTSDAEFEGDIKWKGRSLGKLLEKIEDRLAILQEPSPEKLEKYAALKKAYEHYKTLERLIGED
jgi:hypothetical protein